MDNLLQNENEMQDEELYALLDKAMETERLCVSEELIQKTLKRVAEQEDSKVISFEKAAKRKLPAMKYISVAAAAVFVAVLGVGALRGGVVSKDKVQMEATYDITSRKSSAELQDAAFEPSASVSESRTDGTAYYYSTSDTDGVSGYVVESEATVTEDRGARKENDENEGTLEGTTTEVSAELADALNEAGLTLASQNVEYWELVQTDVVWEAALYKALAARENFDEMPSENGAYRYILLPGNGNRETIRSDYPLDGIVRVETEVGVLWGFVGEHVLFYLK